MFDFQKVETAFIHENVRVLFSSGRLGVIETPDRVYVATRREPEKYMITQVYNVHTLDRLKVYRPDPHEEY